MTRKRIAQGAKIISDELKDLLINLVVILIIKNIYKEFTMRYNALSSSAINRFIELQILLSKSPQESNPQEQPFQQQFDQRYHVVQSAVNAQELNRIMTGIEEDANSLSDWKFTVYVLADYGSKTIIALSLIALGYFIITEDGDPTSQNKNADRQFLLQIGTLATTILGSAGTYVFSGRKQEAINKKSNLQMLHATASIFFKLNSSNPELLNSQKEPWYKRLCCTNCISSCWDRLSGNQANDQKNANDKKPKVNLEEDAL